jgi:uncharacterized tellurite resistance protein B-like protein
MGFWELFKNEKQSSETNNSRLHDKMRKLLPEHPEQMLIKDACVAGLMARVAYIDRHIDEGEVETMKGALKEWTKLNEAEIKAIVTLAVDEIKDLAGLQNHKYCHPLNDYMDNDQKYEIIETLFAVAGGDGQVAENEVEEIRLINKGLRLEHKHFISARATVLDKLNSLKA